MARDRRRHRLRERRAARRPLHAVGRVPASSPLGERGRWEREAEVVEDDHGRDGSVFGRFLVSA